ncbi:MAG: hypothetical protein HQL84_06540 [Magnetococcales bacterium]|nr:hypothetical protein [Magnetococcales bacterium]MBF0149691.1 hypothetical protein [Magnetococcales bacterium]MBF0174978.1 hypothetical protein [Magnetococcales bacterium]MBF0630741.1 hypothetical protein [Magnetococcales bacterium]
MEIHAAGLKALESWSGTRIDLSTLAAFDPQDLWTTALGVRTKERFYQNRLSGKIGAVVFGSMDWFFPQFARHLAHLQPRVYPIVIAQTLLLLGLAEREKQTLLHAHGSDFLGLIRSLSVNPHGARKFHGWGHGFVWMSKNGLYEADMPVVTHLPYVMEALLLLAAVPRHEVEGKEIFDDTWPFLESLPVMHDAGDELALAYAAKPEPWIVVNANTYAAYAYALHQTYGHASRRHTAREKCRRMVQWVARRQNGDGSWNYYHAEQFSGNFIDCFHSCFTIKNLIKIGRIFPEMRELIDPVVACGMVFLRDNMFDHQAGLCRRFVIRSQTDPFRWDLYDQAEYMGLLVDLDLLDEAEQLRATVERIFFDGQHWYCRIDLLGRRWGKNFLRWGIMPFLYQRAKLIDKQQQRSRRAPYGE